MKKIILLIFMVLILSNVVVAANVNIDLFYGKGCPHCEKAIDFLEKLNDPEIKLNKYEVYFNQENRVLFEKMASSYNISIKGVPTIFIGDKSFAGFSNEIKSKISEKIKLCEEGNCESKLNVSKTYGSTVESLKLPAVISAAAVDAINPCAFAVLIILITGILASKNRKKALFAGIAFSISIFISYFLMGLGLYSAIGASGIGHTFFIIVAILAILIGLFNLKDYLWYGKLFVMEVPRSWRPKMKSILRSVTSIPGAFITGFVVSLFLLPCTSGPYIVILGLLSQVASRQSALILLVIYNLIFITPMLLITLAIYFGFTTTQKAEEWRTKKLRTLHLIAGIILILLGIGMIIAILIGAM